MAQIVTITDAGRQLIAQAVSGRTIEFTGGGGSETNYTLEELKTASESDLIDIRGVIRSASASSSTTRITLELSNEGITRQYQLKTFTILAKLSGSNASPVPFAASSQDTGAIAIDTESVVGSVIKFTVPFNITLNGSSNQIVGTPGNYASIGDLDRFVSTHAPGSTQKGEDQRSILGYKRFLDALTIIDKNENVISFLADDNDPDAPEDGISVRARMQFYSSRLTLNESELRIDNANIAFYRQCNVGTLSNPATTVYATNIGGPSLPVTVVSTKGINLYNSNGEFSGRIATDGRKTTINNNYGLLITAPVEMSSILTVSGELNVGGDTIAKAIVTTGILVKDTDNNNVGIIANGVATTQLFSISQETQELSSMNPSQGFRSIPQRIPRAGQSPVLSLNIGDFILIKKSSSFVNKFTNEYIMPGDLFKVTQTEAQTGQAPYIAAVYNGQFVEPSGSGRPSVKVFIGPGTYMVLTGFWKDDTNTDMPILIKKINAA